MTNKNAAPKGTHKRSILATLEHLPQPVRHALGAITVAGTLASGAGCATVKEGSIDTRYLPFEEAQRQFMEGARPISELSSENAEDIREAKHRLAWAREEYSIIMKQVEQKLLAEGRDPKLVLSMVQQAFYAFPDNFESMIENIGSLDTKLVENPVSVTLTGNGGNVFTRGESREVMLFGVVDGVLRPIEAFSWPHGYSEYFIVNANGDMSVPLKTFPGNHERDVFGSLTNSSNFRVEHSYETPSSEKKEVRRKVIEVSEYEGDYGDRTMLQETTTYNNGEKKTKTTKYRGVLSLDQSDRSRAGMRTFLNRKYGPKKDALYK